MTAYVNSVTQYSITIASGSTTGTATISAAVGTQFLVGQGINPTTTNNGAQDYATLTISGTTVTATRNTSTTNTVVVNFQVVDATSSLIKTVQSGTISITTGNLTNTATISAVTAGNTAYHCLGYTSTQTSNDFSNSQAYLSLSGTTLTATRKASTTNMVIAWTVIEFQGAALNSSTQCLQASWTNSSTTSNQTITSIDVNKTIAFWAGDCPDTGLSQARQVVQRGQISAATTFTLGTQNAAGAGQNYSYCIVEFATGVLNSNVQRGNIALSSASNTATITAVTASNTLYNFNRMICGTSSADLVHSQQAITGTSGTVITATVTTAQANNLAYYEVAEFTNVVGIAFDAASNSGYQTAQTTYSWNHTVTGANTFLVVGISMLSIGGSSVSGITFNGISMDFLGAKSSVTGAIRSELWGQIAPSSGTHSIAVTLSTGLDSAGGAVSYTGVNQSSPTEALNTAQATNVGAADATVAVTTVGDNDWVVDCTATDDTAITIGTGNTSRSNVTGTLGSGAVGDNNAAKTPAGSVTMSWTNVGALATWAITAIAIRPTADANIASKVFRKTLSGIGTKIGTRQLQGWS